MERITASFLDKYYYLEPSKRHKHFKLLSIFKLKSYLFESEGFYSKFAFQLIMMENINENRDAIKGVLIVTLLQGLAILFFLYINS
jgi:hypothetical protein